MNSEDEKEFDERFGYLNGELPVYVGRVKEIKHFLKEILDKQKARHIELGEWLKEAAGLDESNEERSWRLGRNEALTDYQDAIRGNV